MACRSRYSAIMIDGTCGDFCQNSWNFPRSAHVKRPSKKKKKLNDQIDALHYLKEVSRFFSVHPLLPFSGSHTHSQTSGIWVVNWKLKKKYKKLSVVLLAWISILLNCFYSSMDVVGDWSKRNCCDQSPNYLYSVLM